MKAITTAELQNLKERGEAITLINTLPAESFAETHIPDSINIPRDQDDFAEKVEQAVGGKSQPIVVYCASEDCPSSTKAAKELESQGFTNVSDYEGGAKSWKQSGHELAHA
ncbi:rhodanese-like domain-containing protein [Blastopirellula sp. J2-11]|uniref:rhodanese-like domain-containing protein n=1 Tax=Blastopirellula sp. J2-11 TaxID=2943192 RepID=UPI0021C7FA99|nr:rhodanese-like domain-containing protein [Blastopirellula sp. J2-11]UUO08091.1 rhodanese-like domain-containing protein [Blastopirellula sp. J2-11]